MYTFVSVAAKQSQPEVYCFTSCGALTYKKLQNKKSLEYNLTQMIKKKKRIQGNVQHVCSEDEVDRFPNDKKKHFCDNGHYLTKRRRDVPKPVSLGIGNLGLESLRTTDV